jgi:transmembrane sensor
MEQKRLYDLIRKYADDKATPEELQELNVWYHTVYGADVVEWPADSPAEKEQLQQQIWERLRPRPRVRMLLMAFKAAACLLLIAGAWMTWRYMGNKKTGQEEIIVHNPSGEILRLSLPDSSQVWLNAATTLRYKRSFSDNREIFLEGEGYFDVTEDAAHPFIVHAGQLTTRVLGTSFDVRSFSTELNTTVTVIRGKVQVENHGKVLDRLTPARQLQFNDSTRQNRTLSVDTSHIQAWRNGYLQFDDMTLEEMTGQLERWYKVKITIQDAAVRKCRVLGSFANTTPLPNVLQMMSRIIDMHYTLNEKDHTVLLWGPGCQ